MLDEIEISKTQLTYQNGKTVLIATVTNTTNKETEMTPIKIILYDKQKNRLGEVKGLIPPIKPKESTQLNIGIQEDYANAYDFKIEKR